MRFIDPNIRLLINDEVNSDKKYEFKAYLEKSDVATEIISQQLPFSPISFTNDQVHLRNLYRVSFVFNVFSEDKNEAINNYIQLHDLFQTIKPNYSVYNSQYIPDNKNLTGILSLKFKGLPKISKTSSTNNDQDKLRLHLTNFNYTINTDMGYIEAPYTDNRTIQNQVLPQQQEMRLIPIAYKLSIDGRVLLKFIDTVRGVEELKASKRSMSLSDLYKKLGIQDQNKQKRLNDILFKLTGKYLIDVPTNNIESIIVLLNSLTYRLNVFDDNNNYKEISAIASTEIDTIINKANGI